MEHRSAAKLTSEELRERIYTSGTKLPVLSLLTLVLLAACIFPAIHPRTVEAQKNLPPGLEPYTPTKIEWVTLESQAALRDYYTLEGTGFYLDITNPDSETVLIYVRYTPQVIREAMNSSIDTARKVIQMKAKSHGWEGWIKIKEDVEMVKKP